MRPQAVESVGSEKSPAERAEGMQRARAMASELQARNGVGGQTAQAVKPVDESPKARPPELQPHDSSPESVEPRPAATRTELEKMVTALREQSPQGRQLSVTFEVSADDPPVIILRDAESGEEVRRIPPEKTANLSGSIEDLKGLLVDSQA